MAEEFNALVEAKMEKENRAQQAALKRQVAAQLAESGALGPEAIPVGMAMKAGAKALPGRAWEGAKSTVKGALGTNPVINMGFFMVVLAGIVNIALDALYPFAGFDLSRYGAIGSFSDLSNAADLYFILKGPILVMLSLVGAFALNRRHAGLRVFVAVIAIVYTISQIPVVAGKYFVLAGIDLLVFILFCIQMLRNPDRQEFTEKMIFWIPVYGLLTFSLGTGNFGAVIHLVFIILFYMIRGSSYAKGDRQFRLNFIYLVLFDFFLMWALQFAPTYGFFQWTDIPILLIGTLIIVQIYEPSKLSGFTLFVVLIGIIMTFGYAALTAASGGSGRLGTIGLDSDTISQRLSIINPLNIFKLLAANVNRSIAIASGDAYTGSVDENAKKKLGVFLEDVEKNPKTFTTQESVVLFSTLTAENLVDSQGRPQQAFPVHVSCFAVDLKGTKVPGTIYPRADFNVEQYTVETLQCTFGQMPEGRYEVAFRADFPFVGEAYLKRYFVSKERIDSLRRSRDIEKDEDVLALNGISDTRPQAQSSAGPLQIKASERIPVVMKLDTVPTTVYFGLQLENAWTGAIDKLSSITISVPSGSSIPQCSNFAVGETSSADEGYTSYIIEPPAGPQTAQVLVPCYLELPASNPVFLDQGEVTTRYFRMSASYDYALEKKYNMRVLPPPQQVSP